MYVCIRVNIVELVYDVMKGTEYFVSLQMNVVQRSIIL
jgi:hypothetical protein